ncbi:hypothetical protein [Bacillus sp. T3]|uniref:hypothetical protein n=1 Tax=Bacillus sp. T3 TaxID=467262 RepID=UPI002981BFDB|nr:hypothetical protein [Bacillus sp. T3]
MVTINDEMLSALGYDAIDLILGIDSTILSETEKRMLVNLILLSNEDELIWAKIKNIFEVETEDFVTKMLELAKI